MRVINIGANPNDGTGDTLRTSFTKVNDNFSDLADMVVPAGGIAGQVLAKSTNEDHEVEWVAPDTGPAGKSAYEVAVDNGFVGTEVQWLESLVGSEGPPGIQGIQGPPGTDGQQGPPGADGKDGEQGPPGADGKDGEQGPPGEGVPTGGTPGQVLVKISANDYDTAWTTPDYNEYLPQTQHVTEGNEPRPNTLGHVHWVGDAMPENGIMGDTWVSSSTFSFHNGAVWMALALEPSPV